MYKGINNPVKVVEAFGIPVSQISVVAEGGTVTRTGDDSWVIRPTEAVGETVLLSIRTKDRILFARSYEIKPMPGFNAYIAYKDTAGLPCRYRGKNPIPKTFLMKAESIGIEYGGDNYPAYLLGFTVQFQDAMGGSMLEYSANNKFTDKQKKLIRKLKKGDRFLITNIEIQPASGTRRRLPPMEVVVE